MAASTEIAAMFSKASRALSSYKRKKDATDETIWPFIARSIQCDCNMDINSLVLAADVLHGTFDHFQKTGRVRAHMARREREPEKLKNPKYRMEVNPPIECMLLIMAVLVAEDLVTRESSFEDVEKSASFAINFLRLHPLVREFSDAAMLKICVSTYGKHKKIAAEDTSDKTTDNAAEPNVDFDD